MTGGSTFKQWKENQKIKASQDEDLNLDPDRGHLDDMDESEGFIEEILESWQTNFDPFVTWDEAGDLRRKADTILDKYWKYYKFIYSDKSNEIFDEEHDGIYYNIQGFNQTYDELHDDLKNAEEVLSPMAIEKWFSLLFSQKQRGLQPLGKTRTSTLAHDFFSGQSGCRKKAKGKRLGELKKLL